MKYIVLFSGICLTFSFASCKKLGCMDVNALNYETEAKKNDESCTYVGSVGIWFDSIKAKEYAADSVISLTYFIDGKNVATIPSGLFPSATPTCDSPEIFNVDFNMGKASTASHSLLVKRETGAVIDSYNFTVDGGSCSLFLMK